jgi:flagellar biosynthesis protein FliQ
MKDLRFLITAILSGIQVAIMQAVISLSENVPTWLVYTANTLTVLYVAAVFIGIMARLTSED